MQGCLMKFTNFLLTMMIDKDGSGAQYEWKWRIKVGQTMDFLLI
jgi:hypothetical protein